MATEPSLAMVHLSSACFWYEIKDYKRALAECQAAIGIDPYCALAFRLRGRIMAGLGDLDRALGDFTESIRLDRSDFGAFRDRAAAWWSKPDVARAIADCDEAIRLNDRDQDSYLLRGDAMKARHEYARAIVDYEAVIQIDPDGAWAHQQLAWIFAACPEPHYHDGRRAVAEATRACELNRWKRESSLSALAASLARFGDTEAAARRQDEALRLANRLEDRMRCLTYLFVYKLGGKCMSGPRSDRRPEPGIYSLDAGVGHSVRMGFYCDLSFRSHDDGIRVSWPLGGPMKIERY